MTVATRFLLAAIVTCLVFGCTTRREPLAHPALDFADLVILGGDVRTMDPDRPRASALAVRDGKVLYVGDDAGAMQFVGPATDLLRVGGVTVLPGLIDTHIHAAEGALGLGGCSLEDKALSIDEVAKVIRQCLADEETAAAGDERGWLVVREVNGAGFKADRHALDAITADRPLLLYGADGHTGWVNTKGLAVAGITRETPDPPDGRIERDASGEPTGFLVDGALAPVFASLEEPAPEERLQALSEILPQLNQAGITSYLEANTSAETLAAYVELARSNELTARVSFALSTDGVATDEEFARLRDLRSRVAGQQLLRADFIKLFADGVMEYPTQTAALLEPYFNADGTTGSNRGRLYIDPQAMQEFVRRAAAENFNIHIHAIGDAAVREALDAFAAARAAGSRRLYSIAHLQLIAPEDLSRFAQLDVFPSLQLFWALPDNYSIDAVLPYIGLERHRRLYPARSLVAAGATITGGSDWDVSTFNPFEAMAVGMSRINPDDPERGTLNANEALTLDELLRAYTINAARLIGREVEIGSLTPGKAADLIVLDRTLTPESTPDDVRATKVKRVFFGGMELGRTGQPLLPPAQPAK